jgi:hypothetical protein
MMLESWSSITRNAWSFQAPSFEVRVVLSHAQVEEETSQWVGLRRAESPREQVHTQLHAIPASQTKESPSKGRRDVVSGPNSRKWYRKHSYQFPRGRLPHR